MVTVHIKGPMLRQKETSTSKLYQEYYHVMPRGAASTPARTTRTVRPSTSWGDKGSADNINSGLYVPSAQAKAYDKWHAKANARAENMMNILELEKSMLMITKRASQLVSVVRHVKNLRFGDAYDALDVARSKRPRSYENLRKKAKYPADAWLELEFGWKPMIQDIGTSVEILQREFPVERIKAVGTNLGVQTSKSLYPPDWYPYGYDEITTVKATASYSGIMRVTNPNLLLANQLGFVNPAAIIWDAVPFSFVVDWFIPVGRFLKSYSNNFGFEILDPISAWGMRCVTEGNYGSGFGMTPSRGFVDSYRYIRGKSPFARPSLFSRAHFPVLDTWKAATSVSLLIQQLNGLKR